MMTPNALEDFTAGVLEALYFTDTGGEGQPASDADIDPDTLADLRADCRSWWRRFGHYVMADTCTCSRAGSFGKAVEAGRDFWFTRNGHGVGFWAGDWSENYAGVFTTGSEAYGTFDTYAGDDGRICS